MCDKTLVSLYRSIYNLDLNSKNIKNSVPLWSKVVDKLIINMKEEKLKKELNISDKDFEELKLGYNPSKSTNKLLISLYEKYCNKKDDKDKVIELIYKEMNKKKYDLTKMKIYDIKFQGGKEYTAYIESKQHTEKTLKIISDGINFSNKEYIINLQLYEPNNLIKSINKNKITKHDNKLIVKDKKIVINNRKGIMIGEEIIHEQYGKGIIIKLDNDDVIIQFNDHKNIFNIDYLISKNLIKKVEYYFDNK